MNDHLLPHCQLLESRSLGACLEALASGEEPEVFLAVSRDFYDAEHYDLWAEVYPKYKAFFEERVAEISRELGADAEVLDWESDEFPEWAVGEWVAIWEDAGVHLRLHHEDREVPILVALARNE